MYNAGAAWHSRQLEYMWNKNPDRMLADTVRYSMEMLILKRKMRFF